MDMSFSPKIQPNVEQEEEVTTDLEEEEIVNERKAQEQKKPSEEEEEVSVSNSNTSPAKNLSAEISLTEDNSESKSINSNGFSAKIVSSLESQLQMLNNDTKTNFFRNFPSTDSQFLLKNNNYNNNKNKTKYLNSSIDLKSCFANVHNSNFSLNNNNSTNNTLSQTNNESFFQNNSEDDDDFKWPCPTCTFLNWYSATSCCQCETQKPSDWLNFYQYQSPHNNIVSTASTSTSDDLRSQLATLKISCNDSSIGSTTTATSALKGRNLQSPNIMDEFNLRGADVFSSEQNTCGEKSADKWTCLACTYDNWPRSTRCVMCLTQKPLDPPSSNTNSHDLLATNNNRNNERLIIPNDGYTSNPLSTYDENLINDDEEVQFRGLRRMRRERELDNLWLQACRGVVDGVPSPIAEYLAAGGNPARQLTQSEVTLLDRPSAFDIGLTLIHLALRFRRENVLATLLSQVEESGDPPTAKRVFSYAAPGIAADIRRQVMGSIRQRKGSFRCNFVSENVTFTLPSEIEDLSQEIQETLFDEILDRDVQKELEDGQIINWAGEITDQLSSRLYPLWNRSAGDCLLDSVLQATWGIFDRESRLRMALADSLQDCSTLFYQRWRENELLNARLLNFSLNENQCATDWAKLLSIAGQPGSSLEQLHIFALAHILRRPIIVYGVKYVKSFRGETLGYARYEGVYLPFFWEPSFCWKWPIVLGYTRGHFSALVPMHPDCDPLLLAPPSSIVSSSAPINQEDINGKSVYLPLINSVDGSLLPIHFLTQSEIGKEERILNQWLDLCFTEGGIMVCRLQLQKRPFLVSQMLEEWMNHYRRIGQMTNTNFIRQTTSGCYSSDGDSDND